MRVAHFIQRYPPALGGSEAYFARLGRYLAAAGHEVTVFTSTAVDLEALWSRRGESLPACLERDRDVQIRRYAPSYFPGRRYLLKALSFLPHRGLQALTMPCNPVCPAMWRDAGGRDLSFDVVHATAFPYAWPIACGRRLARRLQIPFFITPFLHLGDPDDPHDRTRRAYLSPALRALLLSADGVFVQTKLEHDAVVQAGVAEASVSLAGLGVDPAECTGGDRVKARKRWHISPQEVVVGHLANNSVEKGTVDLLKAADLAWHSGLAFRVLLAGPEMRNFQEFWRSYSSTIRVQRLGILTEEEKRDFYAAIDLFVLPSRSDSFGLVILEAWANGVPSVAYRAGGLAEVIRDGQDGLLVRPGDIEGLAKAVGGLVKNGFEQKKLGRSGYERTKQEFGWDEKLRRVSDAYAQALTPNPSPQGRGGKKL
jgi:glycosyltransferase involved in cell wall biosynthesis